MTNGQPMLINNKTFEEIGIPMPNANIQFELNIETSNITKSIIGTIEELDIVNNVPKIASLTWQILTQAEISALFAELNIDFPNAGTLYTGTSLEDNIVSITAMFPMGERTFNAYVGQTIKYTQNWDVNKKQYVYKNLQISFVGIGG